MARSLMVRVLPVSMEMLISSLIAGLARKNRVGTTLNIIEQSATNVAWIMENKGLPEVTELLNKALELLEHLGVHIVARDIEIGNLRAVLLPQLSLDLLEVKRSHVQTRALIDSRLVTDDARSKRLGETTVRLAEVTLEELDN